MRFALLCTFLAGVPVPDRGLTLTPLSGEVRVTAGVGIATVAVAAPSALSDRQIVSTGIAGTASIAGAGGWSATLGKNTMAAVRTLPEQDGARLVFRRALELVSGEVSWKATSDSLLILPHARIRAVAAQLRIFYFEGEIKVEAEDGQGLVELLDTGTLVTLTGGQKIMVRFNPDTNTFQVDVVEDKGEPVELLLGATTIEGTKGDSFLARVDGNNLDVNVLKGVVDIKGPNGRSEEVGAGTLHLVPGGGVGAVQGVGDDAKKKKKKKKKLHEPERRLEPIRDILDKRTEISPAGLK